jgi:hypothetical protein
MAVALCPLAARTASLARLSKDEACSPATRGYQGQEFANDGVVASSH